MINRITLVSSFIAFIYFILFILFILWGYYLCMIPKISNKDNLIKNLIRQTARWSVASSQDESPLVSLLHSNYGVAYVSIVRDIATDKEIKDLTGLDIIEFQRKVSEIQDKATRKVSENCPNFIGNMDPLLLMIAGHK